MMNRRHFLSSLPAGAMVTFDLTRETGAEFVIPAGVLVVGDTFTIEGRINGVPSRKTFRVTGTTPDGQLRVQCA